MLKNHILKLTELTNKQEVDEEDIYSFLKKLPTIQKMFIVQNLLTELISIKNPFLETKNKMIEKIENNCYRYYKYTIQIKEIYDYCTSKNPEKSINYVLLRGKEAESVLHEFEESRTNFITNFFFELRNNNVLMMKIIKEIDINYYEQLGYFLTQFLYHNTTNTNFSQDELNLMIFLVMEDTINNKFPNEFSQDFLFQLNSEREQIFLYYFIVNLTKKVEIRNYLSNIFHDLILDLESKNQKLSMNTTTLIREVINRNPNDDLSDDDEENDPIRKSTMNTHDLLKNFKHFFNSSDIINPEKKNPLRQTMISNPKKRNEKKEEKDNDIINNINVETELIKNFYEANNVTKDGLSKMLFQLNNKDEERTEYEKAFMEYLLFLQSEFRKSGTKKFIDLYSNQIIFESFMEFKKDNIKTEDEGNKIDEKYIINFMTITGFIQNLFEKILQSIDSLPYTIKCLIFFFR